VVKVEVFVDDQSLAYRQFLKQQLNSFKMVVSRWGDEERDVSHLGNDAL
jgi:hypothetical protein